MRPFFYAIKLIMILTITFSQGAWAADDPTGHRNPSRVINLIDYVGTDYKGAVSPQGEVLKPSEFQEMQDFCAAAVAAAVLLELPADPARLQSLQADLAALQHQISAKAAPAEIASRATDLKARFIQAFGVATWPRRTPIRAQGAALYKTNCSSCHGLDGKADTPAAHQFTPPPRPFANAEVMQGMSPFKAFNVMTFGVEGTAMPSFQALSDNDRWNIAFHLFELRFTPEQVSAASRWAQESALREMANLKTLSTSTDGELLAQLAKSPNLATATDGQNALAWLREVAAFTPSGDPLQIASHYLQISLQRYHDGDPDGAYQSAVDSYLEGFENAEASLGALDRSIVGELETRYGAYRDGVRRKEPQTRVAVLERTSKSSCRRREIS